MTGPFTLRKAREGEHEVLTQISIRASQQAWNYSDEFMAWEPEAIYVTEEHIRSAIVVVLELDSRPVGFYVLTGAPPEIEMARLMIAPEGAGRGNGRLLWDHAVANARATGASSMRLDADPNAEPFYAHMGAVTEGEHDWEPPMMPGWRLKRMRFPL
jgi:GNAT superfamily N-acetyltransferase